MLFLCSELSICAGYLLILHGHQSGGQAERRMDAERATNVEPKQAVGQLTIWTVRHLGMSKAPDWPAGRQITTEPTQKAIGWRCLSVKRIEQERSENECIRRCGDFSATHTYTCTLIVWHSAWLIRVCRVCIISISLSRTQTHTHFAARIQTFSCLNNDTLF